MGRYAYIVDGDFDWIWKFWFATQCSNFGFIIEIAQGNGVHVSRHTVEHGEYVKIDADKEKLIESLKNLKIDMCPICGDQKCLVATREMIKDFVEAVEKYKGNEIHVTLFAEYV